MDGNILNGNLSYEIGLTKLSHACKISVYAFSSADRYFDIELLYRREVGGEWFSDMNIQSTNAAFADNANLFKMRAMPAGYENIIIWNCQANGLTPGSFFQIKADIVPSATTFNFYDKYNGSYTFEEKFYGKYHEISSIIPYKVVGVDNFNNYMGSRNGKFVVVSESLGTLFEVDGVDKLACAQQMQNGHYLVLDEFNSTLTEVSEDGAILFEFNDVALLDQPKSFVYDGATNNVLISGGAKHVVVELSWNEDDKGDVIWGHGTFASGAGVDELSFPTGVAYDNNRQIVYIVDAGNHRIKKITRISSPEDIEIIDAVIKDGVNVTFNNIHTLHVVNNQIMVVEQREIESYSEDVCQHPSLSRALKYNQEHVVSKNKLTEYENLLFAPLMGKL